MKALIVAAIFAVGCASTPGQREPAASDPFAKPEAGTFFASSAPIEMELSAPLAELFAKKDPNDTFAAKKHSVQGLLSLIDGGKWVKHQVKIKMRGFSTLNYCAFPKLELKFLTVPAAGAFKNTKSIDLNTHCDRTKGYSDGSAAFNHREELAYQFAHALGVPTLSTRPIFIRYRNTAISKVDSRTEPFQAFAVEDMSAFELRLNAQEIKDGNDKLMIEYLTRDKPEERKWYKFENLQSAPVDLEDASRIALFQALIGNGDWYVKPHKGDKRFPDDESPGGLWNIRVLEMKNGKWIIFPQDFNLALMTVGNLPFVLEKKIYNVTSRASRDKIKATFVEQREALMKLTDKLSYDIAGRDAIKKMLANFYEQLALYQEE